MRNTKNNVTLIGNMGSSAQITNFKNGSKVARFNLATSGRSETEWHRVFAWGNMAHFIEKFGKKGREVAIHGRLVNRTYLNKEGKKRQVTEVEVKHIMGL